METGADPGRRTYKQEVARSSRAPPIVSVGVVPGVRKASSSAGSHDIGAGPSALDRPEAYLYNHEPMRRRCPISFAAFAVMATSLFCAYHASHAQREACGQSVFAAPVGPMDCLTGTRL